MEGDVAGESGSRGGKAPGATRPAPPLQLVRRQTIGHFFMKAVAVIKRMLGLRAAAKSRSGFLIAVVAVITVGGKEVITHIGVLNTNEAVTCMGLGIVGFLFWLAGRLREGKRAPPPSPGEAAPGEQPLDEDPLAFLKSLRYWGVTLLLSAAILSFFAAPRDPPVLEVRATARPPEVTVALTNAVATTNETPAVSFPPLELQGLIVNGAKSSAVINGRALYIGQRLGEVVLVAVDRGYVTVELHGETKWLVLQK